MSTFLCGLTGVVPDEPVFSKSGYIFEKRLIEKYLKENSDTCPITGEPLTIDELFPIKTTKTVKPRAVTATSIPGLLSLMQNEWDTLMTETFSLRNHVETVRHQLSHALYQHDAACRVIARLLKERDILQHQINQLQSDLLHAPESLRSQLHTVTGGIDLTEDALEKIKTLATTLLTQRKSRSLDDVCSVDKVKKFHETGSYAIHSTTIPGVSTCCVSNNTLSFNSSTDTKNTSRRFWSGGVDGSVALFDLELQQTIARLIGHLKRINQIIIHPNQHIVLTCSDDKTVRLWVPTTDEFENASATSIEYKTSYILRKHTKPITGMSLHPSGDYITTCSKDKTWGLHEVHSGQTCRIYSDLPCIFKQVSFHPDGLLLGAAGADSKIHVYDLRGSTKPMVALEGHEGSVIALSFSENGYYLATVAEDNTVKLWDLRKSLTFETLKLENISENISLTPENISFDNSGRYLAVSGKSSKQSGAVALYYFESRTKLDLAHILENHTDIVTCASFGENANYLITSSMDRTVKIWEP